MFWGVTIESGKKYSQIVEASYHLSMAALEPIPKVPKEGNKLVSVMLEHQKSDFVLCTLEHGKMLQINLDLVFQEGEEVTFYLTGEGTVHLTGYIVGDLDSLSDEDSDQETEEVPKTTSPSKSPAKLNLAEEAEKASSSDDEDADWSPSTVLNASGKRPLNGADTSIKKLKQESSPEKKSPKKGSVLLTPKDEGSSDDDDDDDDDEDDDIDSDEVSDMDDSDLEVSGEEDEDDDDDDKSGEENNGWGINAFGGNNQKVAEAVPLSKKKKKQLAQQNAKAQTPQQNAKAQTPQAIKTEQKIKNQTPQSTKGNKQQHQQQKTPQTGKGDQTQKTPQQSGKKNQKTPNQFNQSSKKGKDIETSFSGQTPGGKKQKKQEQQTPNNQLNQSAQQSPKSGGKSKKLQGGVQVEDILEGKGPVAKPGKYVHVYYTGKLPNNKEFDSLTKGKPFGFRLGKGEVIKGWDVALDGMKVGGKRKFTVPPTMGYGGKSSGPIPPNSTLHFEVELKAVQ